MSQLRDPDYEHIFYLLDSIESSAKEVLDRLSPVYSAGHGCLNRAIELNAAVMRLRWELRRAQEQPERRLHTVAYLEVGSDRPR